VRRGDLAVVFRNVAILVAEGVPIERAFAASEALVTGRLRTAIEDVRMSIREGQTVGDALERHEDVFPRSIVGIVRAGERGSRMEEACQTVANGLEADARLRSELLGSLTYPTLILVVGVASIIVMGAVVIPRFAEIFEGFGAELPPATRALLAVSGGIRRFGPLTLLGAVALGAGVLGWLRGEAARLRVDAMLLRLPVVGALRLGFSSARTCRALGGMLGSGMPLLVALDAASDAAGDREIARRLMSAREAVAHGRRLADALTEESALTPVALQLVGVGENGGKLGAMLARAGDIAADRAQLALRATLSLAEPLLIIALGGMVAAVAAALLQAVYSVRP
jgi:type II secretory pathway component PulF